MIPVCISDAWDKNEFDTIDVSAATGASIEFNYSLNEYYRLKELTGKNEDGETILKVTYEYDVDTGKNTKVDVYFMDKKIKDYPYT